MTASTSSRASWRAWFWFVLAGTILGTTIAAAAAVFAPANYSARVTLLVSPVVSGDAGISNSDLELAQAYIPTLAEFTTIRPLLEKVITTTGIPVDADDLAKAVSTRSPVGTSLLTISVADPDPQDAAALANGIAAQLATYASPGGDASGSSKLDLTVVDPAQAPTIRDGPGLPVRIGLGGVIALFLTISIAFLVENVGRGAQNLGRGVEGLGRRNQRLGTRSEPTES